MSILLEWAKVFGMIVLILAVVVLVIVTVIVIGTVFHPLAALVLGIAYLAAFIVLIDEDSL